MAPTRATLRRGTCDRREKGADVDAVDVGGETSEDQVEHGPDRSPIGRAIGWIVGAVLIFIAQRDLRRRPPELVRGRVGVWRAVAMIPPGAVVYLICGRRRAASQSATQETAAA